MDVRSNGWRPVVWPMAALVAWVAVLGFGFHALWRYKSAPGEQERSPARWPADTRVSRDPRRPTLLMFVHPRCPCTSASLSELGRLLARVGDRVHPSVVIFRPRDADADWDLASLWKRAAELPGITVVRDDDGTEAERFHVFTSGMVLLYDARGRRTFSGGITASRGHEGQSFGQRRIVAILDGRTPDRDESPVFGCAVRPRGAEMSSHVHAQEGP